MSEELQTLELLKDENEIAPLPKDGVIDYARKLSQIVVGNISASEFTYGIGGGSVNNLLDLVFPSPIAKRKDAWLEILAERVQWLLNNGLTTENLQNNDKFIDAVIQATQIAIRTSQREKIEALKNAIVNVAIDDSLDESLASMYLNLIDQLTPIQINMLSFFDVNSWEELDEKTNGHRNSMGTPNYYAAEFFVTYHNLDIGTEKANLFWKSLESFGLVSSSSSGPCATDVGKDFLRFISEVEV
jgi:hypothetical protein